MAATRHLLARDGYDQVSIDAIAKEAGVSRPTIYDLMKRLGIKQ